jgi:hypothetical protein
MRFVRKYLPFLQIPTSALIAWAAGWLAPLEGAGIGHPSWEEPVRRIGALIGALLSIVAFAMLHRSTRARQMTFLHFFLALFLLSLVLCVCFGIFIDEIRLQENVVLARQLWRASYLMLCISFIVLIPSAFILI